MRRQLRDKATNTLWRDFLSALLVLMSAGWFLVLPFSKEMAEDSLEENSPGQISVEVRWDDNLAVDIDTWMLSPGDLKPVGYSNTSGQVTNLLRDDLGHVSDFLGLNFENMYTRGMPPGEYIVNVHMYGPQMFTAYPIKVKVVVMKRFVGKRAVSLFTKEVEIKRYGDEVTVIRFVLDDNGNVVSSNTLPKKLRSMPK